MADGNNVPNRKVAVGAGVLGAITFIAAVCDKLGFQLETAAWLGAATAVTFIVQWAIPNAET